MAANFDTKNGRHLQMMQQWHVTIFPNNKKVISYLGTNVAHNHFMIKLWDLCKKRTKLQSFHFDSGENASCWVSFSLMTYKIKVDLKSKSGEEFEAECSWREREPKQSHKKQREGLPRDIGYQKSDCWRSAVTARVQSSPRENRSDDFLIKFIHPSVKDPHPLWVSPLFFLLLFGKSLRSMQVHWQWQIVDGAFRTSKSVVKMM